MKPGDFPIGSPESRAAARAQLTHWRDSRERIEIISHIPRGKDDSRIRFGAWQDCPDGKLLRLVYVPLVWLKRGEAIPACPDCRTPFKKAGESVNMVGYQANCLKMHDPDRIA